MNETDPASRPTSTGVGNTVAWGLQLLAAAAFIAAGSFKLAGAPQMVQLFEQIGVGQWFRLLTGAIEVGCGLALLVPRLAPYSALALAATMTGAALTHLFVIGGSPMPALVLMVACLAIAWLRREHFSRRHRVR